jgi:hypothetical protein
MLGLHLMTYTAANGTRWGIGPVGDGTWRHTIGISIVLAGHGYALYRSPKARP